MASAANLAVFPLHVEIDYVTGTLSQVDSDGCTALYTVVDHQSAQRDTNHSIANITVTRPDKPTVSITSGMQNVSQGLHKSQPAAPHTSWSAA